MHALGLTTVSSEHLRTLLRAVFKEQVECPLTPGGLAGLGLQDTSGPLLSHLRGLDARAVHAVLVATLAERAAVQPDREPRDDPSGGW
ncbi:MAG: hypothetical protein KDK70_39510 [Myxococcales bacterium]|nr:hypothetical protein [Myxococcales bacterium]